MRNMGSSSGDEDGGSGAVVAPEAYSGVRDDVYYTAVASTSSGVEGSEYLTAAMSEQQISSLIETSREQGTWSELKHDGPRHDGSSTLAHSDAAIWEELKRSHPRVFQDFHKGWLQLGQVIAEGSQATIYQAKMHWENKHSSDQLVVKVFKMEGFSLADLQRQWPQATKTPPQSTDETLNCKFNHFKLGGVVFGEALTHCNLIHYGTFSKDGRFAFVMPRYWGDLRSLINLKVKEEDLRIKLVLENSQSFIPTSRLRFPPFSHAKASRIMLDIAKGMKALHDRGVLHRDLKAANVLIQNNPLVDDDWWYCNVADYESSMQVQGTGFWRAPEVLKELLKKACDRDEGIWTEKVDIYSYAMTCYEVLTGLIPFVGFVKSDWERVFNGERPHFPDFVDPSLKGLVEKCWDVEPHNRPEFDTIVEELKLLVEEEEDEEDLPPFMKYP
ncbi:hypothetical protein KC19_10G025400 [Ceratodon purpureus]|uniref:Protein kinase domain-containing protein n=1 Tax=Ceratodon purpureus TaxID=3225 RepID=A0A8T0GJP9_CERPU|nr:hypothetical protein KC19_10G025400 [Ceratodon purpureus]